MSTVHSIVPTDTGEFEPIENPRTTAYSLLTPSKMAQDAATPPIATEEHSKPDMHKSRRNSRANRIGIQAEETRICVVMVGLPARGKSLIASKGK